MLRTLQYAGQGCNVEQMMAQSVALASNTSIAITVSIFFLLAFGSCLTQKLPKLEQSSILQA